MECVHCGECIDPCGEVLGRLGRPTLIRYAWGETGAVMGNKSEKWYQRIGLPGYEARGAVVYFVVLLRGIDDGAVDAAHGAGAVPGGPGAALVHDRLARVGGEYVQGQVVSNRGTEPAGVSFRIEGLPGAVIEPAGAVLVDAGAVVEQDVEVLVAPGSRQDVTHVKITARAMPGRSETTFATTFRGQAAGKGTAK